MRNLAMTVLLLSAPPAFAQSGPKAVKTLPVEASHHKPLFTIADDGTVTIDWRRVEEVARTAGLADGDTARALIAVRDGVAKSAP